MPDTIQGITIDKNYVLYIELLGRLLQVKVLNIDADKKYTLEVAAGPNAGQVIHIISGAFSLLGIILIPGEISIQDEQQALKVKWTISNKPTELYISRYIIDRLHFNNDYALLGTDLIYPQSNLIQPYLDYFFINKQALPLYLSGLLFNLGQDWTVELNTLFVQNIVRDKRHVRVYHTPLQNKQTDWKKGGVTYNLDLSKQANIDALKKQTAGQAPTGTVLEIGYLLNNNYTATYQYCYVLMTPID